MVTSTFEMFDVNVVNSHKKCSAVQKFSELLLNTILEKIKVQDVLSCFSFDIHDLI